MSFISKLWKDRVSDYPNKRKLTKEDGTSETVTVERAEGDIVVAGDAFNAENMNDLETRIQNGFNAVEQAQAELNEKLTSVIGFPDYSNSEILITNKKGSGTITENGWLAINESGASSEVSVKINNKITYSVRLANSLMIPVSSGDTWEVAYFTANYYLWFIQNKTI